MPAIDLTGKKFGRLTVIERAENDKKGNAIWLCKCSCGKEKAIRGWLLRNGKTKSCGCLRGEVTAHLNHKLKTTHGATHTRLYNIWRSMRSRCDLPSHKHYRLYGGRGISVCEAWSNSFETFSEWSLLNGYTENLTIDRIDNDGNYEPTNCRWTTMSEQNRNRRPYKQGGKK